MNRKSTKYRMNGGGSIRYGFEGYGSAISSLAANVTSMSPILPSFNQITSEESGLSTVDVAIRQPYEFRRQSTLSKLFSFRRHKRLEELQLQKEKELNTNINQSQPDVSTLYDVS